MSYQDLCEMLRWSQLTDRRLHFSLIECYKLVFGLNSLCFCDFFEHVVRAANIERFNSRQLAAVFVYWHAIDLVHDSDMVSNLSNLTALENALQPSCYRPKLFTFKIKAWHFAKLQLTLRLTFLDMGPTLIYHWTQEYCASPNMAHVKTATVFFIQSKKCERPNVAGRLVQ